MSQSYVPSTDISIWPFDVQVKGNRRVRVNAPHSRKAAALALAHFAGIGAKRVTEVSAAVVTAEMMHRILGIDSALTAAECKELAAR